MVRLLLSCSIIAFAFPAPALAQARPAPAAVSSGADSIDKSTQTEDVRFKNETNDRMTVPVTLGGRGPYRFLVDTGANRTAISRELASRLQLVAGADVNLHSVVGVSDVATAKIPELQLTRRSMNIADAPLLDSVNMGADGILGTDSLAAQRVMFDFTAMTMSIVPANAPDFQQEPGTIVVTARRRNGRLVVTDATANGHEVTVVLDTGSEVSIGNDALRAALQDGELSGGFLPVEIESVTGEKLPGEVTFIKDLEVGGVTLKNLAIVFARAHTFDQLQLSKKPALLLGMNAIRAFKKVSIDFAHLTLRVIVPEHSSLDVQSANRGRAAISWARTGN
jgi:predicted aspartyl protease